jgi:hypothetical protein
MKLSAEIFEELKSISPLLAGMEKNNVFSVPEEYFDILAVNLLKRINPNTESKADKLKVPEGYFENLSTTILSKIRSLNDNPADELRSLSPLLYAIQNENVFEVPAGYFRNLQYEILDKVFIKPEAKVVELKKRDSIWKYAAAAVVTGVIGLSSLIMFNTSKEPVIDKETKLAVSASIKTAAQFKNTQQINTAIASLSDDEIIKYLERTGSDVDTEILVTGIDETELPAAKDYLLDDKTLDTYLNSDKYSQN